MTLHYFFLIYRQGESPALVEKLSVRAAQQGRFGSLGDSGYCAECRKSRRFAHGMIIFDVSSVGTCVTIVLRTFPQSLSPTQQLLCDRIPPPPRSSCLQVSHTRVIQSHTRVMLHSGVLRDAYSYIVFARDVQNLLSFCTKRTRYDMKHGMIIVSKGYCRCKFTISSFTYVGRCSPPTVKPFFRKVNLPVVTARYQVYSIRSSIVWRICTYVYILV